MFYRRLANGVSNGSPRQRSPTSPQCKPASPQGKPALPQCKPASSRVKPVLPSSTLTLPKCRVDSTECKPAASSPVQGQERRNHSRPKGLNRRQQRRRALSSADLFVTFVDSVARKRTPLVVNSQCPPCPPWFIRGRLGGHLFAAERDKRVQQHRRSDRRGRDIRHTGGQSGRRILRQSLDFRFRSWKRCPSIVLPWGRARKRVTRGQPATGACETALYQNLGTM